MLLEFISDAQLLFILDNEDEEIIEESQNSEVTSVKSRSISGLIEE